MLHKQRSKANNAPSSDISNVKSCKPVPQVNDQVAVPAHVTADVGDDNNCAGGNEHGKSGTIEVAYVKIKEEPTEFFDANEATEPDYQTNPDNLKLKVDGDPAIKDDVDSNGDMVV